MLPYLKHSRWMLKSVGQLRAYRKNARIHSEAQIGQIANSIQQFGFTTPILIDAHNTVLAGHARLEAAKRLRMRTVPTICLHLDGAQRRAYVIADNRLAEKATWDWEILTGELNSLVPELNVEITGFSTEEIELLGDPGPIEVLPPTKRSKNRSRKSLGEISRCGDVWQLGPHLLTCGASAAASCDELIKHFERITGDEARLAASGLTFTEVRAQRASNEEHNEKSAKR
jgi:hypothetical protein